MATNDFLSQFKLKRLSQSIWFNLIRVLQLLIVIVGLGFFFLLILMNIQINKNLLYLFYVTKLSFIYFLTPHPQPPHFFLGYTPGVLQHIKFRREDHFWAHTCRVMSDR